MTIEHACGRVVRKPWGSTDLRPWSDIRPEVGPIGELWFQRPDDSAPQTALLLKLLFTRETLSIQVHPTDARARSIGLDNGKTEAWYILQAAPDAKVAIGLRRHLTAGALRNAIEDGSIADLVQWRPVFKDDVVFVPAGTIHAIGPDLVIAEIQQHSDTTFRLFDYGRPRELHVDAAVAAATAGPADSQTPPRRLTDARMLLVASAPFVLERITLAPDSTWDLRADHETWVLVLDGDGRFGPTRAGIGEAVFLDADDTAVTAGSHGLRALVAYGGPEPIADLLRDRRGQIIGPPNDPSAHISLSPRVNPIPPVRSMETHP